MPHRIIIVYEVGILAVIYCCYIWYSEEGTGRGCSPPRPLLAVPNVTAHRSTASVPITVLLYNRPLLCGFNVPVKGLRKRTYFATSSNHRVYFFRLRCSSLDLSLVPAAPYYCMQESRINNLSVVRV